MQRTSILCGQLDEILHVCTSHVLPPRARCRAFWVSERFPVNTPPQEATTLLTSGTTNESSSSTSHTKSLCLSRVWLPTLSVTSVRFTHAVGCSESPVFFRAVWQSIVRLCYSSCTYVLVRHIDVVSHLGQS